MEEKKPKGCMQMVPVRSEEREKMIQMSDPSASNLKLRDIPLKKMAA